MIKGIDRRKRTVMEDCPFPVTGKMSDRFEGLEHK